MNWNHDLSQAPRGEEKITKITVDGKERTKREYHVAPVWLAWADGSVTRSYWVPETKHGAARWAGYTDKQEPIAWQHFVKPEHPFQEPQRQQGTDGGEIAAVKVIDRLANAAGVEPSPSDHFILEDVGGGA